MAIYCGIDLGTTNSTISVIEITKNRDKPMEKLTTIPIYQYSGSMNGIDKSMTCLPSYLYFEVDKKIVYTGDYAKSEFTKGDRPMQTVTAVKTRIGTDSSVTIPAYDDPEIVETFDMTQCSALLLKTIMESFKQQYDEPIEHVVITVPAAFNTDEREATITAARIAGFKDPRILDEPTATLLYYINGGDGDLSGEEIEIGNDSHVLVYDLGGGTLDVCIARISKDDSDDISLDIVKRSPREDIGGNDFDQHLGAFFLYDWELSHERIENRPVKEQHAIISRIVSQSEKCKIDLNGKIQDNMGTRKLERTSVEAVFKITGDMMIDHNLKKVELDEVFLPLTASDGPILRPVKYCLQESGLQPKDISMVVLTGGMTKYYAVREALEGYFENQVPLIEVDAQNSVSRGAAIHCYNLFDDKQKLSKLKIKDSLADDIFIKVNGDFKKLIGRELASGSGDFNYIIPEDCMIKIPVFLYYGSDEKAPASFTPISGKYIYLNTDWGLKKGDVVKLRWALDENKVITIALPDYNTSWEISRNAGKSDADIQNDPVNAYRINP